MHTYIGGTSYSQHAVSMQKSQKHQTDANKYLQKN